MTITEIVSIGVGLVAVIGSLVSVVWVISNRPTYKYCDSIYKRIDLHNQEYETLLAAIKELKEDIAELKK